MGTSQKSAKSSRIIVDASEDDSHISRSDDDETGSESEAECAICLNDEDTHEKNVLVFCDGEDCNIAVHEQCYQIQKVPPGDEKWHCHRCEDNVKVKGTERICCPVGDGAFFRTNVPKKYIHVPCAWVNHNILIDKNMVTAVNVPDYELKNANECYICGSREGVLVNCKESGCKTFFHFMCAVENGTLSLYKRSSIKQHCLCEEHKKRRDKSQSNKQASSDVYTGEESSGEISTDDESNLNRNIVSSLTSETSNKSQKTPQSFQKRPLLKPNVQTNDAPPRKFFKAASINPFKPGDGIKVPVKAPNVKISQQNKINANPWEWLKDKLSTLTQTITAIENMPIELQRNLTNVKKEVNSSPLDSLVDSAFDNQSTSLLEEKNNEIMQLKQMLQNRPTAEAYKQLQDELTALKSVDTKSVVQYRINQENALAIFSNLKLPNIMAPTESNISQFLSTLRAILERSSSSQGTPSPVTPNVTTGIPPTTISTQSAPMGSIQSSQSPYTPVNQSPITLPPMSALTSHAYNPPIRNVSIRNIPPQ